MSSTATKRLDSKLVCPKCDTIYLTLTQDVTYRTPIHCSVCGEYLGTWAELETDFIAQGGDSGVFEMHDGQIIRRD
jgi:transcription elongation factor Elf1